MAKLNDPYTSVREIEKLINMDPGLVSYVLKLTNSLLFGLLEEVYSISRAIILLGMSNLKSMISSYSIRLLCKVITHQHVQEYLWSHSLSVAVFSKVMAEKLLGQKQPHVYVFGLLHDIGKIVLYIHQPQNFEETIELGVSRNMDFVSAEKQIFGFSHIEAGYLMVDKLRFTRKMKEVILYHHDPEYGPTSEQMHWIVGFANEMSHNIYDNKRIQLEKYMAKFRFSDDAFADLIQLAQKQVEQYKSLL